MNSLLHASLAITALLLALQAPTPPAATLVLTGGKVWTGDPQRPEAEAVACRDGRIAAAGANEVVNAQSVPGGTLYRIVTDEPPADAHPIVPTLEDGYVALMRVNRRDAARASR